MAKRKSDLCSSYDHNEHNRVNPKVTWNIIKSFH
jgi:hypothetical protein